MADTKIAIPASKQPGDVDSGYVPDVIDYSFMRLTCVEDAEMEEPRPKFLGKGGGPKCSEGKFLGPVIRMNNNELSDINGLKEFAQKMFMNPMAIAWIDLSFNALTKVDPILLEFENLQILYLHGNQIANLQEVDKLGQLIKLKKLMLHGNPVEKEKGYRLYVISTLAGLRNLDGSAVTKCDTVTANNWRLMNKPGRKKKKITAED